MKEGKQLGTPGGDWARENEGLNQGGGEEEEGHDRLWSGMYRLCDWTGKTKERQSPWFLVSKWMVVPFKPHVQTELLTAPGRSCLPHTKSVAMLFLQLSRADNGWVYFSCSFTLHICISSNTRGISLFPNTFIATTQATTILSLLTGPPAGDSLHISQSDPLKMFRSSALLETLQEPLFYSD